MATIEMRAALRRANDSESRARRSRTDVGDTGDGWKLAVKREARRQDRYSARDHIELQLMEMEEDSWL
jgi:hypothetical protein